MPSGVRQSSRSLWTRSLTSSGFVSIERVDIPFAWEFPDPDTYARAPASTGPAYEAIQAVGEQAFHQHAVELATERVREGLPLRAEIAVVGYLARKPVEVTPSSSRSRCSSPYGSPSPQSMTPSVRDPTRPWSHPYPTRSGPPSPGAAPSTPEPNLTALLLLHVATRHADERDRHPAPAQQRPGAGHVGAGTPTRQVLLASRRRRRVCAEGRSVAQPLDARVPAPAVLSGPRRIFNRRTSPEQAQDRIRVVRRALRHRGHHPGPRSVLRTHWGRGRAAIRALTGDQGPDW